MIPKKILEFIISDPIRKIFAILFSFAIWFFVAIDNNYQYTQNMKIVYSGLPESLIIIDSVPFTVATFSGRGRSIFPIWTTSPKIHCDLHDATIGENTILIENLTLPSFNDVTVNFNAKSISVLIDQKAKKEIKVLVPIKGELKSGYSISSIENFDRINIIGPKRIIRSITEAMAESLDVGNRSSSFEQKLVIKKPAPMVQFSKDFVMVKVGIDTTGQRLFTNVPLRIIHSANQSIILSKSLLDTLIIEGPKNRITTIKKGDIEIKVRLTNLIPGEYNLPAEIILPEYIKPVYSNPKRFKIRILQD